MRPGFELRLERYFEGDLDPVEARRFEGELEEPENERALVAAWDARTEAFGLAALTPAEPARRACFSDATLQAFRRRRLAPEEAALVERHLGCADCRSRLERTAPPASVRLEASHSGPPRAKRTKGDRRRAGWRRVSAAAGGLAAAAVFAFVALPKPDPADALEAARPALDIGFIRGPGPVHRAAARKKGDRVRLEARGLEAPLAGALRVYVEGEGLVAACPGHEGCSTTDGALLLELELSQRGSWKAMWMLGASEIPPSTGAFETDLEALDAAGTKVRLQLERWEVR